MQNDIYFEIDSFVAKLNRMKYQHLAESINNAKRSGIFASEVLGQVSIELQKAINEIGKDNELLAFEAEKLLDSINRIIG